MTNTDCKDVPCKNQLGDVYLGNLWQIERKPQKLPYNVFTAEEMHC